MRAGVVVFPGSNCDHDTYHVLRYCVGAETRFLWHGDRDFSDCDLVVLPGGFSFGDYLRTGAIARFSPVMEGVRKHAERGGLVLGGAPRGGAPAPGQPVTPPSRRRP